MRPSQQLDVVLKFIVTKAEIEKDYIALFKTIFEELFPSNNSKNSNIDKKSEDLEEYELQIILDKLEEDKMISSGAFIDTSGIWVKNEKRYKPTFKGKAFSE